MKTFKRFSAILIAVFLMVSMMVIPASAEEDTTTYTITINNSNPGHVYEAYQIFIGDLSEGGVLSNVKWGEGVTDAGKSALGDASTVASGLKTDNAATFATSLLPYLAAPSGSADTLETVTVMDQQVQGYKISGSKMAAGYYLIRDQAGTLDNKDEAHTTLILKVVDNVTITPKASKATVTKKVYDPANFTDETDTGWADSTDGKTGDVAQFILTATLPNDYTAFKHYHLTFHDKMDPGLKEPTSVTVKIDGTQIETGYTLVSAPTCGYGCSFHIEFADLKDLTGIAINNNSKITVEYSANLLAGMTLGQTGNDNTVRLEYSNDPYSDPDGDAEETSGVTLTDTVTVFTYALEIYKRDHSSNPLAGAKFKVEKYDKTNDVWGWVDLTSQIVENTEGTVFTITGIDEGVYRVTETTTPSGYNTIDSFCFRVDADYNVLSDDPSLATLTVDQCAEDGSALSSDDRNPLVATQSTVETGLIQVRVANRGGSQLPETGGIGTTIFYGIGGVLVLGALSLLIVRKRSTAK